MFERRNEMESRPVNTSMRPIARPATLEETRTLEMARYLWVDQSLSRADGKAAFLFSGFGVVAAALAAVAYLVPSNHTGQFARVAIRDALVLTLLAMLATLLAALPNWRQTINLNSATEIRYTLRRSLALKRWALFMAFVFFSGAVALIILAVVDSGPVI